jgi:hypothetical protein
VATISIPLVPTDAIWGQRELKAKQENRRAQQALHAEGNAGSHGQRRADNVAKDHSDQNGQNHRAEGGDPRDRPRQKGGNSNRCRQRDARHHGEGGSQIR